MDKLKETSLVERLTRPIIGIDNRTPLEVFDIMADRIRSGMSASMKREAVLREFAESIRDHAKARIDDGDEIGAAVWRLALQDVVSEATTALSQTQEGRS